MYLHKCVMLIVIKIKSLYSGVPLFLLYLIIPHHSLLIVRCILPTEFSCSRGLVWRGSPHPPSSVSCSPALLLTLGFLPVSHSPSLCPSDSTEYGRLGHRFFFFKWKFLFLWEWTQRSLNLTVDSNMSVFSDSRQTMNRDKS